MKQLKWRQSYTAKRFTFLSWQSKLSYHCRIQNRPIKGQKLAHSRSIHGKKRCLITVVSRHITVVSRHITVVSRHITVVSRHITVVSKTDRSRAKISPFTVLSWQKKVSYHCRITSCHCRIQTQPIKGQKLAHFDKKWLKMAKSEKHQNWQNSAKSKLKKAQPKANFFAIFLSL